MASSALSSGATNGREFGIRGLDRPQRNALDDVVKRLEHAAPLLLTEAAGAGGVLRDGLTHDRALGNPQSERGTVDSRRGVVIKREGHFDGACHTLTILP